MYAQNPEQFDDGPPIVPSYPAEATTTDLTVRITAGAVRGGTRDADNTYLVPPTNGRGAEGYIPPSEQPTVATMRQAGATATRQVVHMAPTLSSTTEQPTTAPETISAEPMGAQRRPKPSSNDQEPAATNASETTQAQATPEPATEPPAAGGTPPQKPPGTPPPAASGAAPEPEPRREPEPWEPDSEAVGAIEPGLRAVEVLGEIARADPDAPREGVQIFDTPTHTIAIHHDYPEDVQAEALQGALTQIENAEWVVVDIPGSRRDRGYYQNNAANPGEAPTLFAKVTWYESNEAREQCDGLREAELSPAIEPIIVSDDAQAIAQAAGFEGIRLGAKPIAVAIDNATGIQTVVYPWVDGRRVSGVDITSYDDAYLEPIDPASEAGRINTVSAKQSVLIRTQDIDPCDLDGNQLLVTPDNYLELMDTERYTPIEPTPEAATPAETHIELRYKSGDFRIAVRMVGGALTAAGIVESALTPKQLEALPLLADPAMPYPEIAAQLGVTEGQVWKLGNGIIQAGYERLSDTLANVPQKTEQPVERNTPRDSVGAHINVIRASMGLSHDELHEITGVPVGTLKDILAGRTHTSNERLRTILTALDVDSTSIDNLLVRNRAEQAAARQARGINTDAITNTVTQTFRDMRTDSGLSNRDIAQRTDVKRSTVQNFFAGKPTTPEDVRSILTALGTPARDIDLLVRLHKEDQTVQRMINVAATVEEPDTVAGQAVIRRAELDLTYEQVHELSDVSLTLVRRFFKGQHINPDYARKILAALNIPPDELSDTISRYEFEYRSNIYPDS